MSDSKDPANLEHRYSTFSQALDQRQDSDRLRDLEAMDRVAPSNNFCSNDYLGLAQHPALKERAQAFIQQWGNGATASRLVSGTLPPHQQVEQKLADFTHRERALLFNSGYQANSTLIPALCDRHTLLLVDKRAHHSLLFGALASRGRMIRFRHNDVSHLKALLEKRAGSAQRIMIITESVFSMDGDRAPLEEIAEVADNYEVLLYVDDAHAIGILGPEGRGLASQVDRIDLLIGTFGKAFGSSGAFVAGDGVLIDYLVNFCSGFIYTTGMSPAILGAVDAALETIPGMKDERERVSRLADQLREKFQKLNLDSDRSDSQIVPAIVGEDTKALELAGYLEKQGIICSAIRPPTVPEHTARLRFTLTALHEEADLTQLINLLKAYQGVHH
ncbi:MAG: aminotransferase class I/II-fold pyridoxal phosphate-dependent enzyme [Bacteroidota bacterium]